MNALELAASNSRWARANVGEKVLLILGLLVLAISLPPLPSLPVIAVILGVLAVRAQVPWRLYVVLIAAPATFILMGVGPLIVTLTPHGFQWVPNGAENAAIVIGRSVVGVAATMLFALTTPMSELLTWFRKIGLPSSLAHVIMLIYRLTGTLATTAKSMWDAQAARLGHTSMRRWIGSSAHQASALFVLSFARARALQEGMELRADASAWEIAMVDRPIHWSRVIATIVLLTCVVFVGLI